MRTSRVHKLCIGVKTAVLQYMFVQVFVVHWLRHCATNRKVSGLIPEGVIGHNPSDRTMTLGLTQPLTEMSTRDIFCE
jgi:hypothetical protein